MIRYYTHQRRHFLKISFLILLILFSMLLAAVTYYRAISIWLCMALIIVDYVMVIFSSKKSGRVSTYNGHVVTICDSQYDLNNPVQINENQKWCEFYYSDLSIRIPLSHELMKNIDIKNASVIMMKPIHYLRVAFANVLFIFFFYDVFCLLFGIILLLKGYQLLLPSLMIMRGIALILFFIGFFVLM